MTSFPKEKLHVLLLENVSKESVRIFEQRGYTHIELLPGSLSEKELLKKIAGVHILGIRSKTQVNMEVLEKAKKLIAVGCFCIGTNQVSLPLATARGIPVFNAPFSNTRSVAELAIGAMIMLIRKIPDKNKAMHEGIWMKESKNAFELRGKTLGILGYGNIGGQLSILAEAMGLKVIFYDPQDKLPLGNALPVASMNDLLKKSDIVSIHIPANEETQHLINRNTLSRFKKGAIVINYARGEVVDVAALKYGLEKGILSGVAMDVFDNEPVKTGDPFSNCLQGLSNVLLTPHIGGSTEEAQSNIGTDVSMKLIDFLENGSSTGSQSVPELHLPRQDNTHRILHFHENKPGVLGQINAALSKEGINILGQYLKTNEQLGYVVLDIDKELSGKALELLRSVPHTVKLRMLY